MKPLLAAVLLASSLASAQGKPPQPPAPPDRPHHGPPGGMGHGPMGGMGPMAHGVGIPAPIAQKLGISPELVKKVRDLGFEANQQLIGLEADLKRAQLELEMYLSGTAVDEAPALAKLEVVTRAEGAVKKNRLGLMLKVRKALGPELWSKLEAELPPHHGMGGGGPGGPGGPHRGPMHGE